MIFAYIFIPYPDINPRTRTVRGEQRYILLTTGEYISDCGEDAAIYLHPAIDRNEKDLFWGGGGGILASHQDLHCYERPAAEFDALRLFF